VLDFHPVRAAIDAALAAGAFPGGVICVADAGRVVWHQGFGACADAPDTVFDVASVTKPAGTMTVLLDMLGRRELELEAPVKRWLPELRQAGADDIRVWHLCAHAAGLVWWLPFYQRIEQGDRDAVLRQIGESPLERAPGSGSLYSDLSFLALGFLLERVGGARLDHLHRERIADRLGLAMGWRPLGESPPAAGIAPTEVCPRRGLLVGEVHDDNAHRMGGVAGHAGLFSSARELTQLGLELAFAHGGKPDFFVPEQVRRCFAPAGVPGSTWRLGWDGPSQQGSQIGDLIPRDVVMHLGFTGCSWVIDAARRRVITLLTNRVHPSRDNQLIKEHRPRIHDALARVLYTL